METKAVILAGGFGTRLRPITCTRPKPMCEIVGESVIERILRLLPSWGVHEAVISTMYMSEYIEENINQTDSNVKISFINESTPLGSAGGAKYAAKSLGFNDDDNILVLSGDGMFDFDLSEAITFHKKMNSSATIITTTSDIPVKYGVVLCNKDNKIYSITEKPSWSNVRSDIVNTGIYIIKKKIFDYIPDDRPFDFSKDLFPHLLGIQQPMYAFNSSGYWCDIGDVSTYYKCNIDALNGSIKNIDLSNAMTKNEIVNNNINCEFPCYISKKALVSPEAKICAYSVIEDNVTISDNVIIDAAIIFENCKIKSGVTIKSSILCENSVVGENSKIMSGCTVGAGTQISSDVTVSEQTSIWPNKKIEKGFYVTLDILFDNKSESIFVDKGFYAGKLSERVNTEYITRLAYAIAAAFENEKKSENVKSVLRIGVMHNGDSQSALIAETVLCAIKNAGIKSYSYLDAFEAQAIFAAHNFMTDIIIFATSDGSDRIIRIIDKNGDYISHEFEQKIENCYKNPSDKLPEKIYDTVYIDSLKFIYKSSIMNMISDYKLNNNDSVLKNIKCFISDSCKNNSPGKILADILYENGVEICSESNDNVIKISISDDGLDASLEQKINSSESVYFDTFHIKSALFGCKTTSNKPFDMCHGIIELLLSLNENNRNLKDLFSKIPEFSVYVKDLSTEDLGIEKRAHVMKELYNKYQGAADLSNSEGINLIFENGNVTVIPRRSGGFKIISEAMTTECAMEISGIIEEEIRKL